MTAKIAAAFGVLALLAAVTMGVLPERQGSAGTGRLPSAPGTGTERSHIAPATKPPAETRAEGAGRTSERSDPVAAAIAHLERTEEVVGLAPDAAAVLQHDISTAAAAGRLASQTRDRVAELQRHAPGGVRLWIAPLATTARADPAGTVVEIWNVQAIAFGSELVTTRWSTTTYDLQWELGEWKIENIDSEPGPTPEPGINAATNPTDLLNAVMAWESVR
jgi:hypothetical protein